MCLVLLYLVTPCLVDIPGSLQKKSGFGKEGRRGLGCHRMPPSKTQPVLCEDEYVDEVACRRKLSATIFTALLSFLLSFIFYLFSK